VKLPKLDELWEQLGSNDSEKAWLAIGNLVQSPDTARTLIGEKIKPVACCWPGTLKEPGNVS
jgi:hypothetical protein